MILVCPNCAARYEVDGTKFPEEGRKVRCKKCGHVWHQQPEAGRAEIEEAINSALYDAFYARPEITTESVLTTLAQTVPLAKTMDEQINRLRNWAEGRARNASVPRDTHKASTMRRMEL